MAEELTLGDFPVPQETLVDYDSAAFNAQKSIDSRGGGFSLA